MQWRIKVLRFYNRLEVSRSQIQIFWLGNLDKFRDLWRKANAHFAFHKKKLCVPPRSWQKYMQKLLKKRIKCLPSPSWFLDLPTALGCDSCIAFTVKTCPCTVGYFYFKWTSLSMISAYARLPRDILLCNRYLDDQLPCKSLAS